VYHTYADIEGRSALAERLEKPLRFTDSKKKIDSAERWGKKKLDQPSRSFYFEHTVKNYSVFFNLYEI